MNMGRSHNKRLRSIGLGVGVATLCIILPAVAQVPPPSRDDKNDRTPHYVDSADYDRQPYYVDGVEYKPYVDNKKKPQAAKPVTAKPAAEAVKPQPTPQSPSYVSQAPQTDLHPYTAPAVQPAQPATPREQVTASSSSSSSAAPYVRKKRPRYGVAIIEALDKISSESVRFEAPIGQPVRYKGLIYTVKACETAADDEPMADVIAYMQVRTNPVTAANTAQTIKSKEIFRGWTYASTPSLNPLEHPIYDAWVIACRKPLNAPAAAQVAETTPKPKS